MLTLAAILMAAAGEPGGDSVKVSRDYSSEFNATVRARPEADLAKPLLCKAWKAMKPWTGEPDSHPALARPAEGTPEWAAALAWLKENAASLDLLRQAGEKPEVGWLLQDASEPALREAVGAEERTPSVNPVLPAVQLAYLGPTRQAGRLLVADALAARRAGEGDRWRADVAGLLGLGGQMLARPLIIEQLIGRGLVLLACEEVGAAVRAGPASFGDPLWADLAGRLDRLRDGPGMRVHAEGERWMVMDAVQRSYTDDGHGDGRVNREGWKYIWSFVRSAGGGLGLGPAPEGEDDEARGDVLYGMYAGQFVSRKEETDLTEKLFGQFAAWDGVVLGRADFTAHEETFAAIEKSRIRHFALSLFLADLRVCYQGVEWLRQEVDGARLVVAAERFRRRNGRVAASAAELVPDLLASVPVDRWTGGPLFYAPREGGFMVYSAGADQDDDHGTPTPGSRSFWPDGRWWTRPASSRPDGDSVIFPAPE